MLDQIRIILVQPTYAGNIGSTARAMKNMGLYDLCMVKPQEYPHPFARAMASSAQDILDNAIFKDSLAEALTDVELAIACSARDCSFKWPVVTAREAASLVKEKIRTKECKKVAIVFGQERIGLDMRDLQLCDVQLQIPAHPKYPVLNIAQAVQVITYEMYMASIGDDAERKIPKEDKDPDSVLATHAEREGFFAHLEEVMIELGFMHPECPKNLMPRVRRLYNKANLDRKEVNILRGILTATQFKTRSTPANIKHKEELTTNEQN